MRTLQEKAADWGTTYGYDMAQRQANRMHSLSGFANFFSESEIELNASRSSRSESLDQRIKDADYAVWKNAFVPAYKAAYLAYVAEWQEKHAKEVA